jgi:hypothetical protein
MGTSQVRAFSVAIVASQLFNAPRISPRGRPTVNESIGEEHRGVSRLCSFEAEAALPWSTDRSLTVTPGIGIGIGIGIGDGLDEHVLLEGVEQRVTPGDHGRLTRDVADQDNLSEASTAQQRRLSASLRETSSSPSAIA